MKLVLTGGPCAGKTTLTNILGRTFSEQAIVVPETASLLFTGGFPRWPEADAIRATQKAIYSVQCQIEDVYKAHYPKLHLILDRATLDGAAYWSTEADDFFHGVGTTLQEQLARYDHVIYLESSGETDYLRHKSENPYRTESWAEASALDEKTKKIWSQHPSIFFIHNKKSFDLKIREALDIFNKLLSK